LADLGARADITASPKGRDDLASGALAGTTLVVAAPTNAGDLAEQISDRGLA